MKPGRLPSALLAMIAPGCQLATARVLQVGAGQTLQAPSAAAAVAQDGDTITIAPGTYYDCAFWRASHLTIAGTGPDVVLSDRACAGKAAFVISGSDVLVRGLVFTRIRVPDGNGAGIRAEGADLTVEDSRFVNDEVGILAGGPGGHLRISGCSFSAIGASSDSQANHAVSAGNVDLLRIERSSFGQSRGGNHIASAALQTQLIGNRFTDAGAASGPLVLVYGGVVTLDGNTVDLAATAIERPGAVLLTGDATRIVVHANTLVEPAGNVPLVRNWTGLQALQSDNTVPANAVAVSDSGTSYHRMRARMATLRRQARSMFGAARHQVAQFGRDLHLLP